jgi:hypothetical protein
MKLICKAEAVQETQQLLAFMPVKKGIPNIKFTLFLIIVLRMM